MSADRAPLDRELLNRELLDRAPSGAQEKDARSSRVVKRSLVIAGHRTSVSLEDAFWRALKEIAAKEGVSLAALVAQVDAGRGEANLSSALRVFALKWALARAI